MDGGGSRDDMMMQFQADILGIPVVRPAIIETTALGAAYAAGLATGVWPDRAALGSHWREGRRWEPQMPVDEARPSRAPVAQGRHEVARLGRRGRDRAVVTSLWLAAI